MKTTRLRGVWFSTALCASLVLVPCAAAQESVPLGYGVPKDTHIYIRGVASQSPDPGMRAFEAAVQKMVDSRIHEDILDLATMNLRPQDREQTRAMVGHVLGLLGKVDWGALMAREVVVAEKLAIPMPEYLFIFRTEAPDAQRAGVKTMLEGFAQMVGSEMAEVRDVERRTGKMTVFSIRDVPVQLTAGAVGDALVLSTSSQLTAATMRRLQSGGKGSLLAEESFQSSLKQLPKSTEGEVYINVGGMLGFVSQGLALAAGGVGGDPQATDAVAVGRALIEELDIIDHVLVSTVSDGTTVTATSLVKMEADFEETRVAALFAKQEPWKNWHRYVPANATGFVFDSGIDAGGLFDLVTALAQENMANAEWTQSPMCQHLREIVGHVSGEMAWVSFPRAGDGGCKLGESVCLFRLEKTEDVSNWLRGHLNGLARFVQSRGQHMSVASEGELHEVRLDAFPWIRPVIGVRDGMVVLATSRAALDELGRVARGEVPDIRSSERFAELGVGGGDQPPRYLDYGQLETGMADLADMMGAIGFFMSMVPEDHDSRTAIKAGVVLAKLASAMRELDLHYDTAADVLPTDSPDTVLTRRIYRYRESN